MDFVKGAIDSYNDIKGEDELNWDELSDLRKKDFILQYCEYCKFNDSIGIVSFDSIEEANKYIKDALNEISEIEKKYKHIGNGRYIYNYEGEDN